jgi:hypothetical protein
MKISHQLVGNVENYKMLTFPLSRPIVCNHRVEAREAEWPEIFSLNLHVRRLAAKERNLTISAYQMAKRH